MNSFFASSSKTRQFIEQLKAELLLNLPGVEAHLRLAPVTRINDLKIGKSDAAALESAVLIILYKSEDRLQTVVILRNEYDGAHSGQISFPGGKSEKSDVDLKYTALREAQEEIGIIPAEMEIIGQLSRFYVMPSNFIVYPFIAYCSKRPDFHPDHFEVKRIIEIDIFKEASFDKIEYRTFIFKNKVKFDAPGFPVGGEFMWGATAMMLSELLQVIQNVAEKLKNNTPG